MVRWLAAILILTALADGSRAQDNAQRHALIRRVGLNPEDPLTDSLDVFDDDSAARFAAQLLAPFPPHPTSAYELLAGAILERIASKRYETALDEYRNLLNNDDPKLYHSAIQDFRGRPLADFRGTDGLTSRDGHALAHDLLLRLPPSVRNRFLQRIDAEAARMLADGEANRDLPLLRRLVREYRASPSANKGLALLGDLAFERGDFEQALEWWRRLTLLPSQELFNRSAGDPKSIREGVNLVRVHAKQTLALLFGGRPDAARECGAFRQLYPSERGSLAGRTDAYHAILTFWRDELKTSVERDADQTWPTFAGSPSRNRVLEKAPSNRLWIDGPAWRVPLPSLDLKDPPPVWLSATRSLAIPPTPFHPVIADGQILISDGQSVRSFDLLTGTPRFRAPAPPANPAVFAGDAPTGSGLAFSVSAAPGRAFARLGDRPGDPQPTRLVCLDLLKPGADAVRTLWTTEAASDDGKVAYFDAEPVVVGSRVYVGFVEHEDRKSRRFLHCFDLDGVPQWQTKLAEIDEFDDRRVPRHGLLVSTGTMIVSATQAGAVVGVDALTGRRMWAFRYPGLDVAASPRGLSSCLCADGRVFLAPADSPNLYCLDAETGRALWERPWTKNPSDIIGGPPAASEIVDLLGTVGGRLIFTDRYRLQALDAATGAGLEWQQPSVGKLPAHGRGLLAGAWVFWPTADPEISWRTVAHADGALRDLDGVPQYYEATTLRGLPAGNVALGQGCLVVAGAKELVVYVPAAAQLPALQRDPQAKTNPAKLFRLAIAQLENGGHDLAKTTFASLDRIVAPADRTGWANLIRERTSTAPVNMKPSPELIEKSPSGSPRPATQSVPMPMAAKLVPAWGPVPGVAPPIEGSFGSDVTVVLDGSEIAFLDDRTGDELFRRRRRVANVDWIGRSGSNLIVAGRDGVEAFDLDLRRASWSFEAPALAAARWQLIDDQPRRIGPSERLGRFRLNRNLLTFFEDRRRAIALDCKTGQVVATETGDQIGAMATANALQPALWQVSRNDAHPSTVLSMAAWIEDSEAIELSEARRRVARFSGGWQLQGEANGVVKLGWQSFPKGPGQIVYQPTGRSSLTGGPAHVFGDALVLLALVPRNYGFDLIRFEREPFRPLWVLPATEFRDGFDVLTATWDERALYFVHAGELQAHALADGSLLWKRALPASPGPWKVERFAGGLIAWPQSSAGLPALSGPVDPITAALTLSVGRRGIGAMPVAFVDANDGTVKQRLDVPHDGGPVFANIQGSRLVVSAGGQVRAWSAVP